MTNHEADQELYQLNQTRKWLAKKTGYKVTSLYNVFNGPEKTLTERMATAFCRAFDEEKEALQEPFKKQDALWDRVSFTASEIIRIDEARRRIHQGSIEEFMHDGVCYYAEELLKKEQLEEKAAEEQKPFGKKPNDDVPSAE